MKKVWVTFVMFICLLSLVGCKSVKVDKAAEDYISKKSNIVFSFEDIKNDDHGPGTYTYPEKEIFKKGDFDIEKVYITETDGMIHFIILIGNEFENEWQLAGGWDVQMFDIYLNFGVGKHKHTLAGRNVKIKDGWDKTILIAPGKNEDMIYETKKSNNIKDDVSPTENLVDDIILPDVNLVEGKLIIAKVNKDKLPSMKKLIGAQVFVLGADGYAMEEHTYNRLVLEKADAWRFGGGTNFHGNPNVIDILGENDALINYKSTESETVFTSIDLIKK